MHDAVHDVDTGCFRNLANGWIAEYVKWVAQKIYKIIWVSDVGKSLGMTRCGLLVEKRCRTEGPLMIGASSQRAPGEASKEQFGDSLRHDL